MNRCSTRSFALFSLLVLLVPFTSQVAHAVDGVVEINQACAENTGCLTGDAPGFPVTIDQSGSDRLTGNLSVSSAGTTVIDITTADITLDLNGFGLYGVTVCTPSPTSFSCTPTASGYGVRSNSGATNVTVRNGTVKGMGFFGVSLGGDQGRIEHVRASHNGVSGLVVNTTATIRGGSVLFSTSHSNASDGIYIGSGGLAQGNAATRNGRNGIRANEVCLVSGNTLSNNVSEGLSITTGSGYGQNVISFNNNGNANAQVVGSGVEIGNNVCGFDTTCP